MKAPRQPLYLARESYRRRRVMDAARMLPLLGLFLFSLPALWQPEGGTGLATAREGLFLFLVWLGLILAAAAVAGRLTRDLGSEEAEAAARAEADPSDAPRPEAPRAAPSPARPAHAGPGPTRPSGAEPVHDASARRGQVPADVAQGDAGPGGGEGGAG